jgi:tetratricopeptide (TPR) repeat protein
VALDRTKVLETAQKHLAKGQYDRAIAEYHKLVQSDPNDVRTWLKIGDLYTRKGSPREACDTYARVARQYSEQGFFLKAVAVYKQILKLDPSRLDISLALAEMYEQLQLVSDALNTYEHVAAGYARQGDVDRALHTLHRMTDLDPENIPVRIKYAEALSKAGRVDEAARAFEIGANLLRIQGRMDDYIKVAERLLFHRPDDVALAKELAQTYLDGGDAKRALSKLQLCFKANPRDITTLTLLARAFQTLGQLPKTVSVYKEIARVHQDAGHMEDRAIILKQILEIDPADAEARAALASYAPPTSRRPPSQLTPPPAAVVAPATLREDDEPVLEMMDEDDDVIALEDDADVELSDRGGALDEEPRSEPSLEIEVVQTGPQQMLSNHPSIPPDVAREAQIARLLTECEVFQRYGLRTKVVEQLSKVLQIAPDHVEARERLKDALIEQGRTSDAIEQLYTLANLFEGDKPQVSHFYYKQILEIDPTAEPARSRVAARSIPPPPSDGEVLFVDEGTVVEGANDDVFRRSSTIPDTAHLDGGEPHTERGMSIATLHGHDVERELPPSALRRGAALEPMSPEEFEAAPLRPSTPGLAAASIERASLPPGEIEEILDEAEFFIAQGLVEEARGTLQDALNSHPEHPLLIEKLTELAEVAAANVVAASSNRPASEDDSFRLAEKLAEELGDAAPEPTDAGSDVLDVETVFAQFKKGVEEQIGIEDSDTHFDLGIAYKEMGLLDDAIHEFELARSNPQRECIAYTLIGLCFVEKGEIPEAIASFKKGLYADNKTDREELGLYFELGTAYELMHDPKEALYYYQKVHKRESTFRNVEDKLRALTRRASRPPGAAGADVDDVDQAFDDLLGED